MVRITEELLRKSSEHNEGVVSTLEEVALHQRDIEKLEHLDRWCRDLKILDLTSNLIPKIESLGRLKKLEYVKLGLNNIEKVENLEGCESLVKLDLTMNFIGDLMSLQSLANLEFLNELYMTGNPCAQYDYYRQYLVATLPQLEKLDGVQISKSERILALQVLEEIKDDIRQQQKAYSKKREKEKSSVPLKESDYLNDEGMDESEKDKKFWAEKTEYTPESRQRIHQFQKAKEAKNKPKPKEKEVVRLVTKDGRRLNVNESKVKFLLTEDESGETLILDVAVFKYMSTEACTVDVQPTYVQVILKGKVLQLVLPDEIHVERSVAERSQASGRLIITMPRIDPSAHIKSALPTFNTHNPCKLESKQRKPLHATTKDRQHQQQQQRETQRLEIDPSCYRSVKLDGICEARGRQTIKEMPPERSNSDSFVDDPSVPPLL